LFSRKPIATKGIIRSNFGSRWPSIKMLKLEPDYFAIGFPRGQLLILIPVRGRLYRRPKSPIKDHLLIKATSKSGGSSEASARVYNREWQSLEKLFAVIVTTIWNRERMCTDMQSTLGDVKKRAKENWNRGNVALA